MKAYISEYYFDIVDFVEISSHACIFVLSGVGIVPAKTATTASSSGVMKTKRSDIQHANSGVNKEKLQGIMHTDKTRRPKA